MNDISYRQIVTIGIPVYKDSPTEFELFSFDRCCKVLRKYTFSIITYKELDIQIYTDKLKEYRISYEIKYFDQIYFMEINGYNQLMVSPFFYEAFSGFQYLLIYQLDAFVFSDKLLTWCEKEFDYIGSPWLNIKWINRKEINRKLPFFTRSPFLFKLFKGKDGLVGNGGFSLRKIDSHIKFAKAYSVIFPSLQFNEDIFWGKYIAAKEISFKIPLLTEALSFSIENDPINAFTLLNYELPFGCHAPYKNEKNSWDIIFNKAGINTSQFLISSGL